MDFKENCAIGKIGEKLGYTVSYFVFTTILFLILILLKKFPESWNYLHAMAIVAVIVGLGILMSKLLR